MYVKTKQDALDIQNRGGELEDVIESFKIKPRPYFKITINKKSVSVMWRGSKFVYSGEYSDNSRPTLRETWLYFGKQCSEKIENLTYKMNQTAMYKRRDRLKTKVDNYIKSNPKYEGFESEINIHTLAVTLIKKEVFHLNEFNSLNK